MSDITELERRITAALDRIGAGLDGIDGNSADTAAAGAAQQALEAERDAANARVAELSQALSDEKAVSAQSEERLKAIREKSERHAAALDIQVFEHQQATAKLDGEVQRLRRACEDLRASNLALREALEAGVTERALPALRRQDAGRGSANAGQPDRPHSRAAHVAHGRPDAGGQDRRHGRPRARDGRQGGRVAKHARRGAERAAA